TELTFEYSPESFTGTEPDFALEVCEAVLNVWQPTPQRKAIINLPATVELSMPNIYADLIEQFCQNVSCRDSILVSLHTHNDRGTGVAASELGILAGGDRVEGTLFGNGERTGNCDLVVMALNLFSQGIDPELDLTRINHVRDVYTSVTKLPIHPRHPYVGELVYTAFSGSHQDAIAKGMHAYEPDVNPIWEVPYLPIDPKDVGRTYQSIIRINSQSGKGGVAYILEQKFGLRLPKAMHPEFGAAVQMVTDKEGTEIPAELIWKTFESTYLTPSQPLAFHRLIEAVTHESGSEVTALVKVHGQDRHVVGNGRGPLEAFAHGLSEVVDYPYTFISYDEHALSHGVNGQAAAYICIERPDGLRFFGAGIDDNIALAAIRALVSALNRAYS
ncbi:MAG: 2-isopropylmalate synthase, partial [Chlamydiia bacterium]|nr:2-isopropylmalate synthase [Chlamydiia bacterium]